MIAESIVTESMVTKECCIICLLPSVAKMDNNLLRDYPAEWSSKGSRHRYHKQ
jgi:hypothetical protein